LHQNFGVYISFIGMIIIFVTLFLIGIISDVMRKKNIRTDQSPQKKSKKKVAAISAVFYLDNITPGEILLTEGRKIWVDVAREEAHKMEGI
jgi:hypothetical protein